MAKMGWEKGHGLGPKQDGIVDPILVRQKEDNKGVGFEGHDDTWLAHQDDFQAVLAALNEAHNEPSNNTEKNNETVEENAKEEKVSLEEVSKKSKKRVHYHKFTRGKDLSNYSADDLGCILGTNSAKRKNKSGTSTPDPEEEIEEVTEKEEDGEDKRFSVQKGSYQEYFAKKMAELKAKGKPSYCPEIMGSDENVEEKVKDRKKKSKEKMVVVDDCEEVIENVKKRKKDKKEKIKAKQLDVVEDQKQEIEEEKECRQPCEDLSQKKKKKKKAKKERTEIDSNTEDCIQNDSGCEETQQKKKKREKKKKDKISPDDAQELDTQKEVESGTKRKTEGSKIEEPPTKKKKSKKDKKKSKTLEENPLPSEYPELPGFKGSNILALPGYGTRS